MNGSFETVPMSFPLHVDDLSANNMITGRESNNQLKDVQSEERGCGISTKSLKKNIGGITVHRDERPWMAGLLKNIGTSLPFIFCGKILNLFSSFIFILICTRTEFKGASIGLEMNGL